MPRRQKGFPLEPIPLAPDQKTWSKALGDGSVRLLGWRSDSTLSTQPPATMDTYVWHSFHCMHPLCGQQEINIATEAWSEACIHMYTGCTYVVWELHERGFQLSIFIPLVEDGHQRFEASAGELLHCQVLWIVEILRAFRSFVCTDNSNTQNLISGFLLVSSAIGWLEGDDITPMLGSRSIFIFGTKEC